MIKTDIMIQKNGKYLANLTANYIMDDEELTDLASQYVKDSNKIKKLVIIPNKLVNIITK